MPSEGGLFVRAQHDLHAGEPVVVDLLAPSWAQPLRLRGLVARTTADGAGIRFEGNEADTMTRLQQLVTEARSATPPTLDAELRLEEMLSANTSLKNAVQRCTAELDDERRRRGAAERRLLELTAELEISQGTPHALELVQRELEVSHEEHRETERRLAAEQSANQRLKDELKQLAADDERSRRLATVVAREMAALDLEATTHRVRADGLAAQLLAAEREGAHRGAELQALMQQLASATERALAAERRAEDIEARAVRQRADCLQHQRRAAELETAQADLHERLQRSLAKEDELRTMVELATRRAGVDEVTDVVEVEMEFDL